MRRVCGAGLTRKGQALKPGKQARERAKQIRGGRAPGRGPAYTDARQELERDSEGALCAKRGEARGWVR